MIIQPNTAGRTDGEIYCDNASDKANLAQYAADNNLPPGTICMVIDTQEVLALKSDGTWKSFTS